MELGDKMRSERKALLLASACLVVMGLVAPGAAMAGYAMYDVETAETVEKGTEVEITGTYSVASEFGGMTCEEHVTLTAENASTAVADFNFTTETCEGFGVFEGCEVVGTEVGSSPTDITSNDFLITEGFLRATFDNCAFPSLDISFPKLTATVDNPKSISKGAISGKGTALATEFAIEFEAQASGGFELVGGSAGTYGIEESP